MKLKRLQDFEAFTQVIEQCGGAVWLESVYGDKYNLKSALSRYIAMADLVRDKTEDLELFAARPEDEALLMDFLNAQED